MLRSARSLPEGHNSWPACAAQGLGVVWPTRVGKLEVNMCRVLRFQPQDRFNTYGLQVGFSPSM